MIEKVQAKTEELRTKVQTRVKDMRGGSAGAGLFGESGAFGKFGGGKGLGLGILKTGMLADIRSRGAIPTIKERVAKLRGGSSGIFGEGGMFGEPFAPIAEKPSFQKEAGLKAQRRTIAIEA